VTKDKKKPEVFDFDHDDGIASQMSDKQIEGMASSLNKLMDKKMREDPEMKKRIEARRAERLARKS
jgi:hypothetical protein|tara:strand:- start:74 stop:271 length:198 start_codon:yes stop_codon:yes gene_type:complete